MTFGVHGDVAMANTVEGNSHTGVAMEAVPNRRVGIVLKSCIDTLEADSAIDRISNWSLDNESRAVYLCNVHSVVTAWQDPTFSRVLEAADMALPDGAPIAWSLRNSGFTTQRRLSGPDMMWQYLEKAEATGAIVSFYGSTQDTLDALRRSLSSAFPLLRIGAMISPPFRTLSEKENAAHIEELHAAGTQTLFVGLGCPKQERWIDQNRGTINAVMLGVGAAFDFHAGLSPRAPLWMQRSGLEWLHRLYMEPRRLAVRYLVTNTIFVGVSVGHFMTRHKGQQ